MYDHKIPPIRDPERRRDLEHDAAAWLRFYLPDVFPDPFSDAQCEIVEQAGAVLQSNRFTILAAGRKDSAATIAKFLLLRYALCDKRVRFNLIVCRTGAKAVDTLDEIKAELRCPPSSALYGDFPLACILARYVGPAPPAPTTSRSTAANRFGCSGVRIEFCCPSSAINTPDRGRLFASSARPATNSTANCTTAGRISCC